MAHRELLFVICFCFLSNHSIGLTFSSKLIHRFSEEAKSLLISGNDNVSSQTWPNKNSFQYLQLLLDNDLKRQKMNLGAQNQLLFPSLGSHTFFYGNDLDWLHYTWIDIGTPNVSFLVALDAGSDLSWVPCDCIQCAPLSASLYKPLDRDLSEYRPSLSTTSRHLSCNHQLCELGSHCKNLKDPCPYIADYADPNTSSSGFLVEDILHLASVSDDSNSTQKRVQASVILGCGRKQTGGYLDGAAPDGVMGLGPGSISVPSLLAKAGLIRKSFSLCFDVNGSGTILFGDQGHTSQKSTPLLPTQGNYDAYLIEVESYCVGNSCLKQSGFKALVDSGASFTYLPIDVYNKIVLEFDKQVNAQRISSQGGPWNYCYNTSSKQLDNVPAMRLSFLMNQSLLIHNSTYYVPQNQEFAVFCLTLQPTDLNYGIIGQNYMTGYRVVFDMENLKLGWSSSNCKDISDETEVTLAPSPNDQSPNPLPTNEQQSVPNKRGVAPAVAGRTSSKHSVASQHIPCLLHVLSSLLLLLLVCFVLPS
ncbi:aspartic proteinase-like protein 1 [Ricinus communis]|uniref:aspartic proteinase-like protein 1 n=1 Tax=Ricinus communis TaxID=3988 RepID=UPI00201B1D93|nr:aspartic proteinase-like protein 1 [Ricinus communis]